MQDKLNSEQEKTLVLRVVGYLKDANPPIEDYVIKGVEQIIARFTYKERIETLFSYNGYNCQKTGRIFNKDDRVFLELDNRSKIPETHCLYVDQLINLHRILGDFIEHLGVDDEM